MEQENLENENDELFEDDELIQEQAGDSQLVKRLRASLKKQGQSQSELATEVKSIRRENTLAKAKVELNDAQRTAIDKMLGDEEFTPEKIRETAAALGFIQNPDLEISDGQANSLNNIAEAGSSGENIGTPDDEFQSALKGAKSQQEVLEVLEKSGWADRQVARWDRVTGQ